jgi:hypothetical protein
LQRLLPALRHLACEHSGPPELTVYLWDNASTSTRLPLLIQSLLQAVPAARHEMLDTRYELLGLNDQRIRTVYRLGPCNILSVFDQQRGLALYWLEDASRLPYWEVGSPLQTLLNWWCERHGLQFLHAAAVGASSGAVLLTAAGGSGKSSTALACLQAGMGYLADDYCLAGQGRVWSLYGTAKLVGPTDLSRFPELAGCVLNRDRSEGDKLLLDIFGQCPQQMLLEAPLKAVVIPRISPEPGQPSRLVPVGGSQALLALAPTTLFQLAGTHQASLSRMSHLLRTVPAFVLELGRDLAAVPSLLEALL